jgi:hypothetical protein
MVQIMPLSYGFTVLHAVQVTNVLKNLKRDCEFQVQFSFMQTVSFQAARSCAVSL